MRPGRLCFQDDNHGAAVGGMSALLNIYRYTVCTHRAPFPDRTVPVPDTSQHSAAHLPQGRSIRLHHEQLSVNASKKRVTGCPTATRATSVSLRFTSTYSASESTTVIAVTPLNRAPAVIFTKATMPSKGAYSVAAFNAHSALASCVGARATAASAAAISVADAGEVSRSSASFACSTWI